ncbi:MAG: RHS repeat domain-containing protein, partial [Dyella sp.]|uniref:RHS repeat protein n=1 Tax=Dyella sp. TaxID=1869338 RepID=UPI003F80B927
MHKSRLGICLWVVVSAFCCASAHASTSTATPEDEYKKLIRVSEDIQPLGEHPFGESISLYDGTLSFQQTDVSSRGSGPLLQLVRQFRIEGIDESEARADYAFGDWDLVIPHIETLTANGFYASSGTWHVADGWEVNAVNPLARCSSFAQPLTISTQPGDPAMVPWQPSQWWRGYRLVVPGAGSQDMLRNPDAATKAAYPAVTKDHWRFSCLANTANGQPGEGFQAQAPDGTKYWFNELVYRYARSMSRSLYDDGLGSIRRDQSDDFVATLVSLLSGSGVAHAAPTVNVLGRRLAWMMVTRIEDRFGNSLVFSYSADGLLTGITASDGRALSITYISGTPRIQSVTLQPSSGAARTWTYGYSSDGKSLVSVTQPDSSRWLFNLGAFDTASLSADGSHSSCITLGVPGLSPASGTITHPSGLVGTFTVKPMKHGRSHVPRSCVGMNQGNQDTQGSSATVPNAWYSFTVIQRSVSGAGVSAQTWNYNYSPANESWSDCTGSCPTTVWTDVVNPDGSTERSTFSNRFDFTESQLQRTDYYAGAVGASALLRTESSWYAPPTTSPLPASAGGAIQSYVNYDQIEKYSPLNKRVITQDGDTYTWQAETFNAYAQVTKQKRCNSITSCSPTSNEYLEESLCYLNDSNLWVLGLPTTVTRIKSDGTTEVESQNVYESTHDTLSQRWRFGQQLMSYTFDSAGNLHTFTDGRGNTTTLGSYKRGIPQSISYPDGTSESLAVDDFGQITSLTDQAGKTTSYAYDGVGRLTQITYPGGDSVAWAPKVFTYAYVNAAER